MSAKKATDTARAVKKKPLGFFFASALDAMQSHERGGGGGTSTTNNKITLSRAQIETCRQHRRNAVANNLIKYSYKHFQQHTSEEIFLNRAR